MTVVDELRGLGIARAGHIATRGDPITEEVPLRWSDSITDVRLQDVTGRFGGEEGEPLLNVRIGDLEDAAVAVLEIEMPWKSDDEAAPHRPSSALLRVRRSGVRKIAIGRLRVAPVGCPLCVQCPRVEVEQSGFDGGAGVAAVPEPFPSGTVNHISAESKVFVGPVDGPVDAV